MPVVLLSDIVIISIIVIITLMIYHDMKFLLSPIPTRCLPVAKGNLQTLLYVHTLYMYGIVNPSMSVISFLLPEAKAEPRLRVTKTISHE